MKRYLKWVGVDGVKGKRGDKVRQGTIRRTTVRYMKDGDKDLLFGGEVEVVARYCSGFVGGPGSKRPRRLVRATKMATGER